MTRKLIAPALAGGALALAGGALIVAATATAAQSPSVSTGRATHVQELSAVLTGTVRPNGADTTYQFEWGLTTAYGSITKTRSAGHGTAPVGVKVTARHLQPGIKYHYRLIADSSFGQTAGRDRTFTTAGHPVAVATTGAAVNPTTSGITLTGIVNPNHVTTSWYFNYGLTTAYGQRTPTETLSSNTPAMAISQSLQGLASGTIFHYQLVAVNRSLPSHGTDGIFMTYPNPAPVPQVHKFTTPRRSRRSPFAFTIAGHIAGPSSIPAQFACGGTTTISLFLHRHRVGHTLAPVGTDCKFSGQIALSRKPGRGARNRRVRLRVLVNYAGDGYLAPARAKVGHVTVG